MSASSIRRGALAFLTLVVGAAGMMMSITTT